MSYDKSQNTKIDNDDDDSRGQNDFNVNSPQSHSFSHDGAATGQQDNERTISSVIKLLTSVVVFC